MTPAQLAWWHRYGVAIGAPEVRTLPMVEGHDVVTPGTRRYRNSAGRVFTVGGSGDRWWVGQVRPGGALRSIDHLGYFETLSETEKELARYAANMRMKDIQPR